MERIMTVSATGAIALGALLVLAGVAGIWFTRQSIARENIVTPEDAAIPSTPVRGPLTLKAQADVIRKHALGMTGGKTYAEMPREVPQLGPDGTPILDASGEPVMAHNEARDVWITVTALTTALNLGILAYALSALVILGGLVLGWTGFMFRALALRV